MIPADRVLIAANDPVFAQTVQVQLRKSLDRAPLVCRLDGVRPHLDRSTDGLILLLVNQPPDVPAVKTLLQELRLLRYSPRLVLLETPAAGVNGGLNGLADGLAERRPWVDSGRDLLPLVRAHAGYGVGFFDPTRESLHQRIARRLLAQTPSLEGLVGPLALAAAHDVTVLIDGETGTGKTFLARLIHESSPRAAHRFLVVSCGALAPNLIESEFFGHTRGAFTGADMAKVGKFAAVGAGTLLLDEIDALGLEHQANLLRVIETGEFEPVGSTETQLCAGRIVVASNWQLEEAVERGAFRRDLYYRLNVMPLHLPPLRERVQDVEPLVRSLAARYVRKFRKELVEVSPAALRALELFPWPGNIRQLENVVQQAVLISTGPELLPEHLPPGVQAPPAPAVAATPAGKKKGPLVRGRDAFERSVILRALEAAGYCRTRAAAALGISRVTLYKKMGQHGLLAKPADRRATTAMGS
jgi:DNA-binding NtrC family response regulator